MRVCIVCFEMVGPFLNGGIGTAYSTMAETLAGDGEVTYLYIRPQHDYLFCRNESIEHWQAYYQEKGVRLALLDADFGGDAGKDWSDQWVLNVSSYVCQWLLSEGPFDVIHFPEHSGFGYATLLSNREDGAFASSTIVVGVHGSHQWLRQVHSWVEATPFLDFMERKSVEWADVLWSPSHYMIDWMRNNDWSLPARLMVCPYILPHSARLNGFEVNQEQSVIDDEIVFFGRLEGRKGLALFCDAIEQLQSDYEGTLRIVFMGRHSSVEGIGSREYLAERTSGWRWPYRVISNFDQPAALQYLKKNRCIAVIPSPVDNSPNTVYECLGMRIPFIACHSGGIPELIHVDDVDQCTFPYKVDQLHERLLIGLRKGFILPRPSYCFKQNENEWIVWHTNETKKEDGQGTSLATDAMPPVDRLCFP